MNDRCLSRRGVNYCVRKIERADISRAGLQYPLIEFRDRLETSKHRAQHETDVFPRDRVRPPSAVVDCKSRGRRRKPRTSIERAKIDGAQILLSLKRFDPGRELTRQAFDVE